MYTFETRFCMKPRLGWILLMQCRPAPGSGSSCFSPLKSWDCRSVPPHSAGKRSRAIKASDPAALAIPASGLWIMEETVLPETLGGFDKRKSQQFQLNLS